MSVQPLFASGNWLNQTNAILLCGQLAGGSQVIAHPIPAAGVISNLVIRRTTAVAGGASHSFTIRKNGSGTAVTCTIAASGTTASDITHSVSFALGDTIDISIATTGTPGTSDYQLACDFTPTTPGVSVYGFGTNSNATQLFTAALFGNNFEGSQVARQISVVSVPGTFTDLYANHRTAPGVGNTRVFVVRLNGVDQDGTGGTPNTTSTVSGTGTTSNATTFSLPVVAGDLISIHQTSTGSPAASGACAGALAFVPTDGSAVMASLTTDTASTAADSFIWPVRGYDGTNAPSATENLRENVGAVSSFIASAIYLQLQGAPTGVKSWTATLRKNGADTALTVTVAGAATTGFAVSLPVTISNTDTWSIKLSPSGTPSTTTRPCRVSLGIGIAVSTAFQMWVSP